MSSFRSRANLDRNLTQNDQNGLQSKVDSATSDMVPSCYLLFSIDGQSVKGQGHVGSYESLLCYF